MPSRPPYGLVLVQEVAQDVRERRGGGEGEERGSSRRDNICLVKKIAQRLDDPKTCSTSGVEYINPFDGLKG